MDIPLYTGGSVSPDQMATNYLSGVRDLAGDLWEMTPLSMGVRAAADVTNALAGRQPANGLLAREETFDPQRGLSANQLARLAGNLGVGLTGAARALPAVGRFVQSPNALAGPGRLAGMRGSIGEKLPVLASEEAARMRQARRQLWNPQEENLYHYTHAPKDFKAFDPNIEGRGMVYVARDPDAAIVGGESAGSILPPRHRSGDAGKRIYPLQHNIPPAQIGGPETILHPPIPPKDAATKQAWEELKAMYAHATERYRNAKPALRHERMRHLGWEDAETEAYIDAMKKMGFAGWNVADEAGISLGVFYPERLRGRYAKLDPGKWLSESMTAGALPAAALENNP